MHLTHLLGVCLSGLVGNLQRLALARDFLLLGKEHAGVALVAGGQGAAGQVVVLGDLDLVGLDLASDASLFSHDGGGFLLDVGKVVGELAHVLIDHLCRILGLIEKVVDVGLDDVGETVENAHCCSHL